MKNIAIVGILACSVFIVGCGEKDAETVKYEREKEMLAMKLAHQREMARIDAKKNESQNQTSNNYTENDNNYQQDNYTQEPNYGTTESSVGSQPQAVQYTNQEPQAAAATQQATDEGYGMGSMALAALGGAAAGYLAGEMLNNGMKSYKDDHGNTHYADKDGRPVSRQAYEDHKKANPKTTAFKEKASDLKAKTIAGASTFKGKVIDTKDKVMQSDRVQQFKSGAVAEKEKIQSNDKYQQTKTYTQDKSQERKGKVQSRIQPAQQTVSKPAPRPVYKAPAPTKRPSTKKRR